MVVQCDSALILAGSFCIIFGGFTAVIGIMAWLRPDSALIQFMLVECYPTESEADPISRFFGMTQEGMGSESLWQTRLLGPLIGPLVFAFGVWIVLAQVQCRAPLPDLRPLFGPPGWRSFAELHWEFVAFGAVFVVLFGLFGVWRAYYVRPRFRMITVLLALAFGVAGFECTAFDVGPQAARWAVIGFVLWALLGFVIIREAVHNRQVRKQSH